MRRRQREARSRAFDWKKAPKIVLLAGWTVFVGWLAVKSATVDALARRNPIAAAAVAPEDPRIPTRLAIIEFRLKGGKISPAVAQAAIRSLQQAPLVDEPFLIAALDSLVDGDEVKAEALLLEARRRDPRAEMARILLLDQFLRTGRVQEAAAEIGAVGRLVPGTSKVLVPQLAKFANDPKTRGALAAVLQSDPGMRDILLEHLAVTGADPGVLLQLAGPLRPTSASAQPPHWQGLLLRSLVSKNEVGKARQLWARFVGLGERETGENIYDRGFRRLPGSPPFNWEFASSPAGVAEPTKTSQLQVDYYGRAEAELASQLLALKPGRYRLSFQAAGDVPERGSSLSWRIVCHPGKVALASLPVAGISYAPKQIRGDFVVPPTGCSAQWLRLVGMPAEFPTTLGVTIDTLQIQAVGAS